MKKETLNYDEIEKLIGAPLYTKKNKIEPIEFELSLREIAGPEPEPKPKEEKKDERKPSREEEFSVLDHRSNRALFSFFTKLSQ